MTRKSDTERTPRNRKRPGDTRREEIIALLEKIDEVLAEAEQTVPKPAEAH